MAREETAPGFVSIALTCDVCAKQAIKLKSATFTAPKKERPIHGTRMHKVTAYWAYRMRE